MYIVLVYDIAEANSGTKTQRHIFKICKKYLYHVQNSVFEGNITDSQLKRLKLDLKNEIREDLDSILIFESANEKWLKKELIGKREDKTDVFL